MAEDGRRERSGRPSDPVRSVGSLPAFPGPFAFGAGVDQALPLAIVTRAVVDPAVRKLALPRVNVFFDEIRARAGQAPNQDRLHLAMVNGAELRTVAPVFHRQARGLMGIARHEPQEGA